MQIAGNLETLLATHHRVTGPRHADASAALPSGHTVLAMSHTERQTTMIVRADEPILHPAWTVSSLDVEELVLAYLQRPSRSEPEHSPPELVMPR